MLTDLVHRRLLLATVALAGIAVAAMIAGSARADTQPPIVTVGPISNPQGDTSASATAGSGGQTDACLNGTHSGASPSTTDPTGAVSVNDTTCQTSSAPTTGGAGGSQAGANGRSVSSSDRTSQSGGRAGSSTAAAGSRATVAAADARGLQITRIKYVTAQVRSKRQLRLIVTVRDIDRRLIRGAIVTVRPLPNARQTITASLAVFTNTVGQAGLVIPVKTQMLGKRLQFVVSARTPKAHALEIGSVRLPSRSASARVVPA